MTKRLIIRKWWFLSKCAAGLAAGFLLLGALLRPAVSVNAQTATYFSKPYDYQNRTEVGNAIAALTDGGYLLVGATYEVPPSPGKYVPFFVKLDARGKMVRQDTFGLPGYWYVNTYVLLPCPEGGAVLQGALKPKDGSGDSEAFLMKFTSEGDSLWLKTYGFGTEKDIFNDVIMTSDGGLLAVGWTSMGTAQQTAKLYLVKTDSAGNLLWQKRHGNNNLYRFYDGISVMETSNGDFMVVGAADSLTGEPPEWDAYLARLDSAGNLRWDKTWRGRIFPNNNKDHTDEEFADIIETQAGDFVIVGYRGMAFAGMGLQHGWFLKVDGEGEVLSEQVYGRTDSLGFGNNLHTVFEMHDGSFLAFGREKTARDTSYWAGWVLRIGPNGDSLWSRHFERAPEPSGMPILGMGGVVRTLDGGFVIPAYTYPHPVTWQDMWVIKLDSLGCDIPGCVEGSKPLEAPEEYVVYLYPNPFYGQFTVYIRLPEGIMADRPLEFTVYDLLGRKVGGTVALHSDASTLEFSFDGSHLSQGLYIYRLERGGNIIEKGKLVKQ